MEALHTSNKDMSHSLYSNWEGFKDSSISADSGHERVGMMGEGSNVMSPSRCSCIYTSPEASCK